MQSISSLETARNFNWEGQKLGQLDLSCLTGVSHTINTMLSIKGEFCPGDTLLVILILRNTFLFILIAIHLLD